MFKRFFIFIIGLFFAVSGLSIAQSNIQFEKHFLSKHKKGNKLVYFFIERGASAGDFYTFFISNQINDNQWIDSLVAFTIEGNPYPENWYNNYCPVVIQDDFNAISMAAFSFPKKIAKIRILAQLIHKEGNELKINMFPMDVEITNDPVQYYLIKYYKGDCDIIGIDRAEMETRLNRTTNYAAQLGKKVQLGFIKAP